MGYFSNQSSIEARISASRLLGYIDADGDNTPDAAALASGIKAAYGIITGYIGTCYDSDTIDAWDIDDSNNLPPALIGMISDDLCIQIYYQNNPHFQKGAQEMYKAAEALLVKIREEKLDIYGVDRLTSPIASTIETGRIASDFDPERDLDDMTVNPYWLRPDARDLDGY